jgi:hypothetical protein
MPQVTMWRTSIACWIHKATNTHSEYVILIVFPWKQCLHERNSTLRYTYEYIVGLVLEPRFKSTKDEMFRITSLSKFEIITAL